MIKDTMREALNGQLNNELYAGYLYMAMSLDASQRGWDGTAAWFSAQAAEELGHAMKFRDYLLSQGARVQLAAVKEPPVEFESLKAMFEGALEHEQFVTGCIAQLVAQARDEDDYATEIFLQWFVTEQVEEEEQVQAVLDKLEMVGDARNALFMLDRDLGARARADG